MKKILVCMVMMAALVFGGTVWASEPAAGGGHGDKPHWGYVGEGGPAHWGDLNSEYAACKEGHSQSPIDITGALDIDQPPIQFSYQAVPLHLVNNGHTIKITYAPGSTITVNGQTYKLLQFHFHSQSENAVNGRLFPMEAHLVHADENGKLAVVGVMFEDGAANPFVEELWKYMPALANSTMNVSNESINVMNMLPVNKDYYSWEGSLTTPPCTEGVKWMLLKEPVTISEDQVKKLQMVMHGGNNRPVQPLYGRTINQ